MTNRVQSDGIRRGLAALIPTGDVDLRRRDDFGPIDTGPPDQQPTEAREAVAASTGRAGSAGNWPVAVDGLQLIDIDPTLVVPNPKQPRSEFDPDAIAELAASLKEVGFLQPIVIRPATQGLLTTARNGKQVAATHELVAGERRWRAAQLAGFSSIPAIVRTTADDDLLREALLENLQRVALNPLEEAAAYGQLLVDFGGTHDELAKRLGKSRPQISNTLRLLKLPSPVANRVAAGVLSAGHARALLSLDDTRKMEQLAKRVVAEGISVRGLEEIVSIDDGSPAKPSSRQRTPKAVLPELAAVADRLSDQFETRVAVSSGKSKGKIVIEFAGVDDLHRIMTLLERT